MDYLLIMNHQNNLKIDWQKVCLNLRKYKPLSQIAKEIGSDWQHLNRLARGEVDQPRFDTGVDLLNLHFDKFPDLHKVEIICK